MLISTLTIHISFPILQSLPEVCSVQWETKNLIFLFLKIVKPPRRPRVVTSHCWYSNGMINCSKNKNVFIYLGSNENSWKRMNNSHEQKGNQLSKLADCVGLKNLTSPELNSTEKVACISPRGQRQPFRQNFALESICGAHQCWSYSWICGKMETTLELNQDNLVLIRSWLYQHTGLTLPSW